MPSNLKLALDAVISVFGIRAINEQPRYDVVAQLAGGVEIRRYAPRLAAEVTVEAPSEREGRNQAFSILAGYIFGKNRARRDIAMTAPVETGPGRDIAMTAPVETASGGAGRVTQRFFLPSALTRASAPEPDDGRVTLVELPEEMLACVRFSGSPSEGELAERKRALVESLAPSPFRPSGPPSVLFYDPPFTIPFLRRNEVAVRVARAEG